MLNMAQVIKKHSKKVPLVTNSKLVDIDADIAVDMGAKKNKTGSKPMKIKVGSNIGKNKQSII